MLKYRSRLEALQLPTGKFTPRDRMALKTVEQVKKAFRVVAGFTLLAAGAVMLITPGPGWLAIFLGLGLLAAEFVWARRLMDRLKKEGGRVKDAVLRTKKEERPSSSPEKQQAG